jgi:hypothetical protein
LTMWMQGKTRTERPFPTGVADLPQSAPQTSAFSAIPTIHASSLPVWHWILDH